MILLTNDDGYMTEGIMQLRSALADIAKVVIAAPEREQSATGHGITMHKPLRANPIYDDGNNYGWSISGTPADCVKLALDKLLDEKPSLVVSGINNGLNLGTDVLYSGTVSAAIEAVIAGVPAFAVSTEEGATSKDYAYAAQYIRDLISEIDFSELSPSLLLNINIPRVSNGEINCAKITTQGFRRYKNSVEMRKDPRGRNYYWLSGEIELLENNPQSDIMALEQRNISLTPLQFDLTDYQSIAQLRKSLNKRSSL